MNQHPEGEQSFRCPCGEYHRWEWCHTYGGPMVEGFIACQRCGAVHCKPLTERQRRRWFGGKVRTVTPVANAEQPNTSGDYAAALAVIE